MTKSLNQAFIKAYSKEHAARIHRDEQEHAAKESTDDHLVMRFDTATVDVPTPRLTTARHQTLAKAAPPEVQNTLPTPKMKRPATKLQPVEVVYSEPEAKAEELRDSIASQMLQAGTWQTEMLGTFLGDVVAPEPSPSQISAKADSAEPMAREPAAPEFVSQQPSVGQGAASQMPQQPAASQPTWQEPTAPPIQNSAEPTEQAASPAPPNTPTHERIVRYRTTSRRTSSPATGEILRVDHAPQGESPTENAIAQPTDHPAETPRPITGDTTTEESSETPKPSATPAVSLPPESQQDTQVSKTITPAPSVAVEPSKTTEQSTAAVEQDLRDAKTRTFNPVWEVDNLHWPHICFDLLQQSGSQMDSVAENLVTACEEGLQVLAVTSPQGGEGRTTIACCLAMLAGSRGLKVAIVDADMESPSLSYQTNLDVEQDWRTSIENQIPLEDIAVHSIDDQVTIVPLLNPIAHNELSTDDSRITSMLQELAESFDLVIVDMGHMNSPRSLVPTMGEYGIISAVVAVVDRRETSPEMLDSCIRRIRQSGIVSIGLVENFAA